MLRTTNFSFKLNATLIEIVYMCLYRVYNVLINSIVESKKLRRDADRLRLKILTELWKKSYSSISSIFAQTLK